MTTNHLRSSSATLAHVPCPVPGCKDALKRNAPLCDRHWCRVPQELKGDLAVAWQRFQESAGHSSDLRTALRRKYLGTLTVCIDRAKGDQP